MFIVKPAYAFEPIPVALYSIVALDMDVLTTFVIFVGDIFVALCIVILIAVTILIAPLIAV